MNKDGTNAEVRSEKPALIDSEFTNAMRQLVVDLDVAESQSLPIESLGDDAPRLIAAFLLVQSGEVEIDLDDPEKLRLAEKGQWLRQGILVATGE